LASEIIIKASARKDLEKIDRHIAKRIADKIEKDLSKIPPEGKLLSGDLHGLYSYRVGDYRVLYTKIQEGVLVLRIGHRREVYK
jgi:mRNA interferase RelE/StbE